MSKQTQTYYIKGMHCASCELVIEKKLLETKGIESADASLAKGAVTIGYRGGKPNLKELNKLFVENGYQLSLDKDGADDEASNPWVVPGFIAGAIIFAFLWLDKLGLASLVNVDSKSSTITFFFFGLAAGVSSCAALVGGLVLSLSKQWGEKYASSDSIIQRSTPHLLFNLGRIVSYGIFGAVLGLVGSSVRLSASVTSLLTIVVSVVMTILGMQMIGVSAFNHLQFALPKSITRKISNDQNGGRFGPIVIGFLTFFLPCGFTIIAQGVAVLSGSAVRGGLIMVSFALGTFIPLMVIGLSSTKMLSNKKWSEGFLKTAGIIVLFFVLYNLNIQFNLTQVLAKAAPQRAATEQARVVAPPISSSEATEAQVLKTVYTSDRDIQPNTFTVKRGQPVRLEVEAKDSGSGCMSTIMVPGLYNTAQYLQGGQTIVMEFTPKESGDYRITCAMGVPRGVIRVD